MRFAEAARQKAPQRQSYICVLCLPKSHSERCQSPYTSWIYGSFVCWQEKQCDKTAGRLASISPPPGAPLDAVHIAGCFKFLSLEELSCMIFFQRLFCLLTGELSECFFFVIRGMFSSRWKEGCARIPFREISIWNSLSVTLTQKWSVETEFNRMMLTFLTQEKRFFFLSFLTNDTHTNLKVEHDSFHNHQTFLLN